MPKGLFDSLNRSPRPSSPATPDAPVAAPVTLRNSRRSWFWSSLPAVLFLALVWGLPRSRPPQPVQPVPDTKAEEAKKVLPESQTLVVTPIKAETDVLLRGRLELSASVTGQAPMSGRVLRVHVRPGEKVSVGDAVVDLSPRGGLPALHGTTSAAREQSSAEAAQVAAVRQQAKLQQKILTAQARLVDARARVAAAQRQVTQARAVVRQVAQRLRNGEAMPEESAPPPIVKAPVVQSRANRSRNDLSHDAPVNPRLYAVKRAALREAQNNAQEARLTAEQATAKASTARNISEGTARVAQTKRRKHQEALAAVQKLEDDFKAGQAEESAVEAARAELNRAEKEAKDADARVAEARSNAEELEVSAEQLRIIETRAARRAEHLSQELASLTTRRSHRPSRTAAQETAPRARIAAAPTSPAPDDQSSGRAAEQSSVEQAVRTVREAVAMSETAVAEAGRIKNEIEGYERKVKTITRRLNATSSQLEEAQLKVVEDTIQTKLSSVRAPASGVVLEVAEDGEEVSPGDTIVKIGQANILQVRFRDHSDAWKSLKPDMRLPATVLLREDAEKIPAAGALIQARVRSITPPAGSGAPAVIEALIYNPRAKTAGARRRFRPGMAMICSVARPGDQHIFLVPVGAVLRDENNRTYVAVLRPVDESAAAANQPLMAASDSGILQSVHSIEWRSVTLGKSNGEQQQIVNGLQPGERIALQPTALEAFTRSNGGNATVRLAAASSVTTTK
ncbi:MAG: hypothetical protein M3347_15140 [Armatimonadota bacterium]|nr:hypothetical protein [Armatimonadota bacterium]